MFLNFGFGELFRISVLVVKIYYICMIIQPDRKDISEVEMNGMCSRSVKPQDGAVDT